MTDTKDMTNCEQTREAITSEPTAKDVGDHVSRCASCQGFREEMLALDGKIGRAMSISVPPLRMPELEGIDVDNLVALPRRRVATPAWFAVAATVAVAAVLGFRMLANDVTQPSLGEQIVAHLEHEPYALANTDKPVSEDRLNRIVPPKVANLDRSNGLITYAQSCVIDGKSVPHLVIQGKRGPVTILLMPDQKVDGPENIHGRSINGVILPVGDGSIAIIGEDGEDLKPYENQMKNSVTWST